jgi:hypothetical protein
MLQQSDQEILIGGQSQATEVPQGVQHFALRFGPVATMRNELGDHRVVVHRYLRTCFHACFNTQSFHGQAHANRGWCLLQEQNHGRHLLHTGALR